MKNFYLKPKLFSVIKNYNKDQFVKDVIAGVIVAIIALPLSIALALASGVEPACGVYTAIFIIIRIITLLILSSLLTYTTSPTDLTDAIEKLLSPLRIFKIDVHTFAMMMTIALRFIPTLIDEIDRIMSAQKARGADFESGNLMKRIKALFPIFIPLIISCFKRAFELADAMSCRCYVGGKGRTRMRKMQFTFKDLAAFLVTVVTCALIIFMNFHFEALI